MEIKILLKIGLVGQSSKAKKIQKQSVLFLNRIAGGHEEIFKGEWSFFGGCNEEGLEYIGMEEQCA